MSPFKRQVLTHFEAASDAMVDIAAAAKAGLLFVTPLSNLRDFAPFKSENRGGLTAEQLRDMERRVRKGSNPDPGQPDGRSRPAV